MIYTVTLNPALDKTVVISHFSVDTVNRITQLRTDPGGKGINVSKVVKALGGKSTAVALLAGATGKKIEEDVQALDIRTLLTFVPGETRTNLKIVDPEGHTNTDINEPGVEVEPQILEDMLSELVSRLQPGDIVVISGSLPKGAPADTYTQWVSRCRSARAKVFLDADGENLYAGLRAKPYLVKPNQEELSRLLDKSLTTLEEMIAAGKALVEQGIQKVVISMGSRGALYITKEQTVYAEGMEVPVGSTVGAGDSVVAALACAEEQGLSLVQAACISTATGAANVMCSGSQAAEYSVIENLLSQVRYHTL